MFLIGFPLLLVPFAIYNIVAFLIGVSWSGTLASVTMKSGGDWTMSLGDILVTLSIALLFVEMMKAARNVRGFVDHGLSIVLFFGMAAEFVLVREAASATFFLILMMSFFDMLGGFILAFRSGRRDMILEHVEPAREVVEPIPAPEPSTPAPAEPVPAPTITEHQAPPPERAAHTSS
jgi:hypothetical protein